MPQGTVADIASYTGCTTCYDPLYGVHALASWFLLGHSMDMVSGCLWQTPPPFQRSVEMLAGGFYQAPPDRLGRAIFVRSWKQGHDAAARRGCVVAWLLHRLPGDSLGPLGFFSKVFGCSCASGWSSAVLGMSLGILQQSWGGLGPSWGREDFRDGNRRGGGFSTGRCGLRRCGGAPPENHSKPTRQPTGIRTRLSGRAVGTVADSLVQTSELL